jgi:hypothetical protein
VAGGEDREVGKPAAGVDLIHLHFGRK